MFHLKDLLRAAFDGVGDGLSMGGARHQRAENQHIQSSLDHLRLKGRFAHTLLSMIDQSDI